MVWPAALVIGGYVAWHQWGAEHVSKKYYGVDPALIHVTARPEYVSSDIARTVYAESKLNQLSLLDPAAAARIATAFSYHPWVRRVLAVHKLPGGGVDVHLQYRRPVAMVSVVSRHPTIDGLGWFVVDEEGVLLPSEFTQQETMKYLHIEVPDVYPTGGVGSSFGDGRVTGAAKLAALVEEYRELLKIRSIRLSIASSRTAPVPQYEFFTADGREYFWGSAPGEEIYGETKSDAKLRQLIERAAVAQNSSSSIRQ